MGTDIHIEVVAKTKDGYIYVEPPPQWDHEDPWYNITGTGHLKSRWPRHRNYVVFGRLCDGIRGIDGGMPQRGLPGWIEGVKRYVGWCAGGVRWVPMSNDWPNDEWEVKEFFARLDLGDHSFSWLTLQEYFTIDWAQDDYDGEGVYFLWPEHYLTPYFKKLAAIYGAENVFMVFGFDS